MKRKVTLITLMLCILLAFVAVACNNTNNDNNKEKDNEQPKVEAQTVDYTVEVYLENLAGEFVKSAELTTTLSGEVGKDVTTTASEIAGYTFDSANANNVLSIKLSDTSANVLKKYYSRPSLYITPFDAKYGTLTVDKATPAKDDVVTITANANEGYECAYVVYGKDGAVEVSSDKFTMPEGKVEVTAYYTKTSVFGCNNWIFEVGKADKLPLATIDSSAKLNAEIIINGVIIPAENGVAKAAFAETGNYTATSRFFDGENFNDSSIQIVADAVTLDVLTSVEYNNVIATFTSLQFYDVYDDPSADYDAFRAADPDRTGKFLQFNAFAQCDSSWNNVEYFGYVEEEVNGEMLNAIKFAYKPTEFAKGSEDFKGDFLQEGQYDIFSFDVIMALKTFDAKKINIDQNRYLTFDLYYNFEFVDGTDHKQAFRSFAGEGQSARFTASSNWVKTSIKKYTLTVDLWAILGQFEAAANTTDNLGTLANDSLKGTNSVTGKEATGSIGIFCESNTLPNALENKDRIMYINNVKFAQDASGYSLEEYCPGASLVYEYIQEDYPDLFK